MNTITISGRLGADVDQRADKNGKEYVRLRIADDVGYGEKKVTNWIDAYCYGHNATFARQFLCKGCEVFVGGHDLQVSTFTTQQGETRVSIKMQVDTIKCVRTPADGQNQPRKQDDRPNIDPRCAPPPMPSQTDAVSDDIPF